MTLKLLAQEKMKGGRHPTLTCQEVLEKHPDYVLRADLRAAHGRAGVECQEQDTVGRSPAEDVKEDFWRHAALFRERQRMGRSLDHTGAVSDTAHRDDTDDDHHDASLLRTEGATGGPSAGQSGSASEPASGGGSHERHPAEPGSSRPSSERAGRSPGPQVISARGRARSRSPKTEIRFQQGVYVLEAVGDDDGHGYDDSEDIGNTFVDPQFNPRQTQEMSSLQDLKLGCFAQASSSVLDGDSEALDGHASSGSRQGCQRPKDDQCFFQQSLDHDRSCCEIVLNVSSRDVHQVNRNGHKEWKINEKPERRAEVQFRNLSDHDKMDFLRAMQAEVGSYLEHEAVSIASKVGVPESRILGMRWVLTWKRVENEHGEVTGHKPKARLIIKGFQDPDLLLLRRDSPTLSTQSRNAILSLCAQFHSVAATGDIKTAFLNGDQTEAKRATYAAPPEEAKEMLGMKPNEIFRILKAVYGLLRAPRCWFEKLNSVLISQGWVRSRLEPCIWKLYHQGKLQGLIGGHVDDLLVCGPEDPNSLFQQKVAQLREAFPFGSWKSAKAETISFCGCDLTQLPDYSVEMSQEKYADTISEINLSKERKLKKESPLTDAEKRQFRVIPGGLAWRSTQTAPWLCASTSYLQGCFQTATVDDAMELNKLVRAQRQYSDTPLHFSSHIKNPVLVTFHDASWSNRRDLSSQGGLITVLASSDVLKGKISCFSPVAWQSKRLPRICRSSTAAEIQMASTAIDSHEFLKQLMLDLFNEKTIPLHSLDKSLQAIPSIIVTDSKNMYDSVMRIESSGLQLEERRLAVEILSYRDRLHSAGIDCKWVDSDQQMADAFFVKGFPL